MSTKYIKLKQNPSDPHQYFDYSSISSFNSISNYNSAFSFRDTLLDECNAPRKAESWSSRCLHVIISGLCHLLIIIVFPISLLICLKRVPSLERIVIIRLGKLQPVKGPGIVIIIPCIDQWFRVNLKSRKLVIQPKEVLTSDGGILEISAVIEYQVADVIQFVMRVYQLEQAFSQLSQHCLINIASEREQQEFERDRKLFEQTFQEQLNKTVISWGLEVTKIEIPPVKILKAAEPVDVVGSLISSMANAMGYSSEKDVVSELQEKSAKENEGALNSKTCDEFNSLAGHLWKLANKALEKGIFKNRTVTYKFQVEENTLYCCFHDDTVEVKETNVTGQSDVSIFLLKENLSNLLSQKILPTDAYQQGKITVSGDWKLLYLLNKMISLK